MKKLIAIALVLGLAACNGMSDREEILTDLAVQSAAVRYIDGDRERAERVMKATAVIWVALTAENTLSDISELATSLIPTNELTPQEVLLAKALIGLVVAEMADRVPLTDPLNEDTTAAIMHYLNQVDIAAKLVLEG